MKSRFTGRSGNERLALCCDIGNVIVHLYEIDADHDNHQYDIGDSTEMIPDIELDDCIIMVQNWFNQAIAKAPKDFEYVIIAHQYKEILRHLEEYRKKLEREKTIKSFDNNAEEMH